MPRRNLLFTQRLAVKEEIEQRGLSPEDFEWGFAGWPGLERETPVLTHRPTGYFAHFCFNSHWTWIGIYPCGDLPGQRIIKAPNWPSQLKVLRVWLDQLGRELAAQRNLLLRGRAAPKA